MEWLNRRVRYVIGVIKWAPCFIDVSLIEAHNVSRRLNGVPSVPGTPPSMPYPLYPWWALHGRGVLLRESGLSLTAYHLSLACCPDGVLTLDPEPVTAFFSSTWYGLDGLLERATLHPYFSQQTGGRCCNKSPASHLYWEDAGLPAVLGCFSCQVEIFVLFPLISLFNPLFPWYC